MINFSSKDLLILWILFGLKSLKRTNFKILKVHGASSGSLLFAILFLSLGIKKLKPKKGVARLR